MGKKTLHREVVIIGSGPAGLTAAIYTARANLKPLLIDAPADTEKQTAPAGQLMITTDVENYPGFSEGIQGPDLMVEFRKQAERFGTEFLEAWIESVDLSERPFTLSTADADIEAETLIIASGASAQWLGIPGEAKVPDGFGGNGVSACATCDGPLPAFRGKHLVVVGGGDTAMEEATFLTRYAGRVFVVHRRDKLRASRSCRTRLSTTTRSSSSGIPALKKSWAIRNRASPASAKEPADSGRAGLQLRGSFCRYRSQTEYRTVRRTTGHGRSGLSEDIGTFDRYEIPGVSPAVTFRIRFIVRQ